jgi:hemerythrin-like domain-containing protein
MDLQRQISRKLHEEHEAVLGLLDRFAGALARLKSVPPADDDPVWRHLLAQLETALQYEVTRHFALEEDQLFPRLHAHGAGDLAELLFEEHESIREPARSLIDLVARARGGTLDAPGWRSLKAHGMELIDRLGSHARKEEESLVPMVDEILDDDTDNALWIEYQAG